MHMIPGKKYVFFYDDKIKVYAIKKNGYIKILYHAYDQESSRDQNWIDGLYKSIRFLCSYKNTGKVYWCYVILKNVKGGGQIIELVNKIVIKDKFPYRIYAGYTCRENVIPEDDPGDCIIRFHDKSRRIYSLCNLNNNYIFTPYKYNSIKIYTNGVIIDNHVVVENDGNIYDVSNYNDLGESIYHDKKSNKYYIFLDFDGSLFYELEPDANENILSLYINGYSYVYNIKENRVIKKKLLDDFTMAQLEREELEDMLKDVYGY